MRRERGVDRQLGGNPVDPSEQPAESQTPDREGTAPDLGTPSVTIRAVFSRTIDGVRVVVDRERGLARVDLGQLRSYGLVGAIRKVADAVAGCSDVEVVGDDRRALDYVGEQLPKELRHVDGWLAGGLDNRGAA